MAYSYSDTANAQFENVNALRSYPFACDPVDMDGRALPEGVISDLKLVAPGMPGSIDYRTQDANSGIGASLTSLHMSPAMLSACFRLRCGTNRSTLSVIVSMSEFRPYFPYRLEKLHGVEDAGGIVTFGDFAPPPHPETYIFEDNEVLGCCIAARKPSDLRSFYDPRSGETIRGDVRIDFSAHIKADGERGRGYGTYVLSLEDGSEELLAAKCDNDNGMPCGAVPIASINGISPDEEGNIVLWFH